MTAIVEVQCVFPLADFAATIAFTRMDTGAAETKKNNPEITPARLARAHLWEISGILLYRHWTDKS